MDFRAFRTLVEETYTPDPDRHCDALDLRLAQFSAEALEGFHETLYGALEWLNLPELQTAAALVELRFDDDFFRAFRCRIVLAPPRVWAAGATNPDNLLPLAETGCWACQRLLRLASDRHEGMTGRRLTVPPEPSCSDAIGIPLEAFAERFPGFFRRFPWKLSLKGQLREMSRINDWEAPGVAVAPRRYVLLGIVASTVLLCAGHVWAAAGLLGGSVGTWLLHIRRISESRAFSFVRHRRKGGHLTGAVPFRVLHIRADATERHITDAVPFQLVETTTEAPDTLQWRGRLDEGLRWLAVEAFRFGRHLEFVEVAPPSHHRASHSASLMSGFSHAKAHVERMLQQMREQGHRGVVIVVSDVGEGGAAVRSARAVCVASSEPSSTYAHELLHLHGALDLYPSDRLALLYPQAVRRWVEARFAADFTADEVSIMDDAYREGARVDRFTARLIGWFDG